MPSSAGGRAGRGPVSAATAASTAASSSHSGGAAVVAAHPPPLKPIAASSSAPPSVSSSSSSSAPAVASLLLPSIPRDEPHDAPLRVVHGHVPTLSSGAAPSLTAFLDPRSGRMIPLEAASASLRVETLDPQWAANKALFLSRHADSGHTTGDEVADNLRRAAAQRPDVFATGRAVIPLGAQLPPPMATAGGGAPQPMEEEEAASAAAAGASTKRIRFA